MQRRRLPHTIKLGGSATPPFGNVPTSVPCSTATLHRKRSLRHRSPLCAHRIRPDTDSTRNRIYRDSRRHRHTNRLCKFLRALQLWLLAHVSMPSLNSSNGSQQSRELAIPHNTVSRNPGTAQLAAGLLSGDLLAMLVRSLRHVLQRSRLRSQSSGVPRCRNRSQREPVPC